MTTTIRIVTLSLAFLIYGSGAQANEGTAQVVKRQAPPGITNLFYACLEKAGSDNIALAACQSAEKERQDVRLNTAYKALLNTQQGTSKENLIRAERAWLDSHSTSSTFESSLYGSETVSSFQVMQNEIFRLGERANVLGEYLVIANDR